MGDQLKILMLEDFLPDSELIIRELKKAGYDFISERVDKRETYIKAIKEFNPDLIISDYNLPQYDGIAAIKDLLSISPDTPIIIVTGSLDEETAAETIKSGAWDYVVKERLYRLPPSVKKVLEHKAQIDKKRKTQKALSATEDELETLRNNIPVAIFRTTTDGKLIYANPAFLEMFGLNSLEEAIKIPAIEHYLQSDDRQVVIELLKKDGVIRNLELEMVRQNGKSFWTLFNIKAIYDANGNHLFQDGIITDITELKKATLELIDAKNKAEESDRLKTAFLANMSHEIRTPMNAIIGFSDLLLDTTYSQEEIENFVKIIQKNGDSLMEIINDIIDVSKIESGTLKVEHKFFELNEILNEIYESFLKNKSLFENKDIELKLDLPDDNAGVSLNSDSIRLRQIMNNLITNAFKFTEKGHIQFGYTIESENHVRIYVEDTGIGIPDDKTEVIFERFRQADDSNTREFGGAGLGLTISKSLVENLGGKMFVESQLNEGSVFYFLMPHVQKSTEENKKGISILDDKYIGLWKDKTILIVEDVDSNYQYLETILQSTQANIIRAVDGLIAVEYCKDIPDIDLVLMDIQLPVMSGYEATRQIKKIRKDLPIIGQTAYALTTDETKVLEAGCDDYIIKPIFINKLLEIIEKFI